MAGTEQEITHQETPQRLTLSFLYANLGEKIVKELASEKDASYAYVFPKEATDILRKYKAGQLTRENQSTFIQDVVTPVMDAFLEQADPAAKQKPQIAQKICKWYLAQPMEALELHKIAEHIAYFDSLKNSQAFKESGASPDLMSYKSYADFEAMLEPFQTHHAEKEARADVLFGLTPEQKQAVLAETTLLYDGADGRVVVPHTPAASKFWGLHTKWCLAGRDYADDHFPKYNDHSPVIMLLPKGHDDDKVALVNNILYNSADKKIASLPPAHRDLMEHCLASLSDGARKTLSTWVPEKIFEVHETPADDRLRIKPSLMKEAAQELAWIEDHRQEADSGDLWSAYPSHRKMWDNRDFVMAAVAQDGGTLCYASLKLQADKDVVLTAVRQAGSALSSAARKLKGDKEIILAGLAHDVAVFDHAPRRLTRDRDFMRAAVEVNGLALSYAAPELRQDEEIVRAAIAQNGQALCYASSELRGNQEIVRAAVAQYNHAIASATPELRGDRDFMLSIIAQDGDALCHARPELKADRDVVRVAVMQKGRALLHAAPELRADRDIVRAAVAQDGMALSYAAPELKEDKSFVLQMLEESKSLAFNILGLGIYEQLWSDDTVLKTHQLREMEKMAAEGDTDALFKYSRLIRETWGDADILLAANPAVTIARVREGAARTAAAAAPPAQAARPQVA